jgi:hypothetical protein
MMSNQHGNKLIIAMAGALVLAACGNQAPPPPPPKPAPTAPAPAKISARWTFGGSTLVNESTRDVAATGNSVTEFHISKPDGWPVGKYSVAISIDGKPVGSKDFDVK